MKNNIFCRSFFLILSLVISNLISPVIQTFGAGNSNGISIILADNPDEVLNIESLFLKSDGYQIIDLRNNTGRVKKISQDGLVVNSCVSCFPLPDAATLPPDSPASPFGLDRMAIGSDAIFSLPAPWIKSPAEKFSLVSGEFLSRMSDNGKKLTGLIAAPSGDIFGIDPVSIFPIYSNSVQEINLQSSLGYIDCAVWHPLGFVVYSSPTLALIDSNGIIRWKIILSDFVDGFLSPSDISCAPDGSIAISTVYINFPDQKAFDEYAKLRADALLRGDIEDINDAEISIRENFGLGYLVFIVDELGNLKASIESASPISAIAAESASRIHVATSESDGWKFSILDLRVGEEIEQFRIEYGTPTLINPHQIAADKSENIYFDDFILDENSVSWGIRKLSSSESIFSLKGDNEPSNFWTLSDSVSVKIARELGFDGEGNISFLYSELNPVGDNFETLNKTIISPDGRVISEHIIPEDEISETIIGDIEILGVNQKIKTLSPKLLGYSALSDEYFITIDSGEIFRLSGKMSLANGIFSNRMSGGAPNFPISDSTLTSDGLILLDREHRAVVKIPLSSFGNIYASGESLVTDAIGIIKTALFDFRYEFGFYPDPSPDMLEKILDATEIEKVKQAFIGGRIYNYQRDNMGYTFTAWSGFGDQPVIICSPSDDTYIN